MKLDMSFIHVSSCVLIDDKESLGQNPRTKSGLVSGHFVAKSGDCSRHVPKIRSDILSHLYPITRIAPWRRKRGDLHADKLALHVGVVAKASAGQNDTAVSSDANVAIRPPRSYADYPLVILNESYGPCVVDDLNFSLLNCLLQDAPKCGTAAFIAFRFGGETTTYSFRTDEIRI